MRYACYLESDCLNFMALGGAAETAAPLSRCGVFLFPFGGRDLCLGRVVGLAVLCVRLGSEATRYDKHPPHPSA
jgi:hypothetical protein